MFSTSIFADNVFYCTSDKTAGFNYIDGKWRVGGFKQNRHTLKFTSNFSSVQGTADPNDKYNMSCQKNDYSVVKNLETIICADKRYGNMLIFNRDSSKSLKNVSSSSFCLKKLFPEYGVPKNSRVSI